MAAAVQTKTFDASIAAQTLKENFTKVFNNRTYHGKFYKAKVPKGSGESIGLCVGYVQKAIQAANVPIPTGDGWKSSFTTEKAGFREIASFDATDAPKVAAWCDKNCQAGDISFMTTVSGKGIGHGAMCYENNGTRAKWGAYYDHVSMENRYNHRYGPCTWVKGSKQLKIFRWNGPIKIGSTIVDGTKGGVTTNSSGSSGGSEGSSNTQQQQQQQQSTQLNAIEYYKGTNVKVVDNRVTTTTATPKSRYKCNKRKLYNTY